MADEDCCSGRWEQNSPTKNDRVNGNAVSVGLCLLFLPITLCRDTKLHPFQFLDNQPLKRHGAGADGGNAYRRAVEFNLPSYEQQ